MKVGAFLIEEPLPELVEPHALCVLRPWIDVGSAGSLTMTFLENQFHAQSLGKIERPGNFFDFTRYRPSIRVVRGQRRITVPNTIIKYAHTGNGHDLVFFHLLEPHMFSDLYVSSVLSVLRKLNVKRYCMIGGMYDAVPHTRPMLISGTASPGLEQSMRRWGIKLSDYEGPTTITVLVSQEAPQYGIETMSMIAHLPQYSQIEDDHTAQLHLLEMLTKMYGLSVDLEGVRRKAEKQYKKLNTSISKEPDAESMIHQFEAFYDSRFSENQTVSEMPPLSPSIEKFLKEIGKGLDNDL